VIRVRLIDLLSGKRSWRYYKTYVDSQWYDRERLDRFRIGKLRRLLVHCERSVPFYRNVMRTAGIRADRIDSLDVLQAFPVIDKVSVRAQYDQFVSQDTRGMGSIHYSQTGGTTGEPLRIPKDAGMRSSAQAARLRLYDWMGVRFGEPVLVLWGAAIISSGWSRRLRNVVLSKLSNTRQVDTFGISRSQARELAAVFRRVAPVLLQGYCQSIYELASWFVENDELVRLKAVSTTVEPLFEEYRGVIRQAFACEAFDEYGCGEVETIAMECPSHQGRHVVEERVVLELDAQNNVIVTDLDNLAFPFIRYRNGDQAKAGQRSCACGRPHELLDRVIGRIGDVIEGPNGKRVHPEFFTHLLNEAGISQRRALRKYQVVQEAQNHLVWRLVSAPLDEAERQFLLDRVQHYLGDVTLHIEEVEEIPVARSGKFQYVIGYR